MKTGGQIEEMRKFKAETTHIREDAKFKVHKWQSNIKELEDQKMPNPSKIPRGGVLPYITYTGMCCPTGS